MAEDQEKDTPESVAAKVARAPDQRAAECDYASWREWTRLVLEIFALIGLACYVHQAALQATASRNAADAAKTAANAAASAAETAAKQLELSERPWVSASVRMVSPLTFGEKGGTVDLSVTLKNTGHSVALDVFSRSKVFALRQGLNRIATAQAEWCEPLRHREQGEGLGTILFPDNTAPAPERTGIDPEEIAAALKATPIKGQISMILITCVDYAFTFSPERHQTRYTFPLGRPQEDGTWMGYFVPEGTPEGVTLIPSLIGTSAD